jgi:ABC-type uncharacterized transport system permease subunit
MSVVEWAESKSHALSIWDTGLLKTYCVLFGMIVGAYASSFVLTNISWFVVGVLLLGSIYGYRWLTVGATRT